MAICKFCEGDPDQAECTCGKGRNYDEQVLAFQESAEGLRIRVESQRITLEDALRQENALKVEIDRLHGLLQGARKVLLQHGGCGCGECLDALQVMLKRLDEFS